MKFLLARIVFYRQYWSAGTLETHDQNSLEFSISPESLTPETLCKASTWISRQTANLNNISRWTQQIAKPPRSRGLDWRTQFNPGSGLSDSGIATWVTRHNCRTARFLHYDPSQPPPFIITIMMLNVAFQRVGCSIFMTIIIIIIITIMITINMMTKVA